MAADGIQALLEMDLSQARRRWTEANEPRTAGADFRMVAENRTWGSPGIRHLRANRSAVDAEGTEKSWASKGLGDVPEQSSRSDCGNGFLLVPTLAFGVLYCFFVIVHNRRRILHCNVTRNPTTAWVAQQLREAFPYDSAPKYLILDREHTLRGEVLETVQNLGMTPVRTAIRSPWQNGVAERFVGNCRRDLLDHVIVLSQGHLKRLINEYVRYYHEDRTHLGPAKQTPSKRRANETREDGSHIVSMPRMGGLHHRYERAAWVFPSPQVN